MKKGVAAAVLCSAALLVPGAALADVPVSVGSHATPFPQNKQNEPAVAIDPINPGIVIAGSNDEIDEPDCAGNSCPFVQGIGNTGVYWSTTGGSSWTQPDYTGYTARTGPGQVLGTGPIGTLPKYDSAGLVSDGDPAVAWGPAPDSSGHFAWGNGERAYFANLTSNFSGVRSDEAFKGYEAIAVSHTVGDIQAAIGGSNAGWSAPSIVSQTRQSSSTFSDKEAVWADNAATSKYFGNVYVCWTDFRSATGTGYGNAPIMLSRSTDGGVTWSRGLQLTAAHNNGAAGGRQGCDMRTDSNGVLYVFMTDSSSHQEVIKEYRSTDGGQSVGKALVLTTETNPGGPSEVRPGEDDNIDGVAGSRTDDFPHVTIANGAPSGVAAPNTIAVAWDDGSQGLGFEHVYVKLSADGGSTWTDKAAIEDAGDRPAMPSVALSPDGTTMYLVYNAFLDPFREQVGPVDPAQDAEYGRRFQAVVKRWSVSGTSLGNETGLERGAIGDGRASSANGLIDEFLGDYNMVSATNSGAVAVYITAENAQQCEAINEYRDSLVTEAEGGAPAGDAPEPCNGTTFGNTDINGFVAAAPSQTTATTTSLRSHTKR